MEPFLSRGVPDLHVITTVHAHRHPGGGLTDQGSISTISEGRKKSKSAKSKPLVSCCCRWCLRRRCLQTQESHRTATQLLSSLRVTSQTCLFFKTENMRPRGALLHRGAPARLPRSCNIPPLPQPPTSTRNGSKYVQQSIGGPVSQGTGHTVVPTGALCLKDTPYLCRAAGN